MEIITSRSNPAVMAAVKLADKKYRDAARLFMFEGVKLLSEALGAGADIAEVYFTEDAYGKYYPSYSDALGVCGAHIRVLSQSVYEKLSLEKSPQGVLCCAKYLDNFHKRITIYNIVGKNEAGKRIFALESLRDPGNLGTIMRTAAALGCDMLLLSDDCADIYNPKTIRAAMGAVFRLPTVRVSDLPASLKALSDIGYVTYAAALHKDAVSIRDISRRPQNLFVVGNEGHGLSDAVIAACSHTAVIPMADTSESLNAAAAASILLWEGTGDASDCGETLATKDRS
ncbi:MAG: RNA methyltransferase [Eubacteriales bacterium]